MNRDTFCIICRLHWSLQEEKVCNVSKLFSPVIQSEFLLEWVELCENEITKIILTKVEFEDCQHLHQGF